MGQRDDARHSVEEEREKVEELAEELSYRARPRYVKVAAADKALEMAQRASASPLMLGLVGGMVGSAVAYVVGRQLESYRLRDSLSLLPTARHEAVRASKVADKAAELRHRAEEVRKHFATAEEAAAHLEHEADRIEHHAEVAEEAADRVRRRERHFHEAEPVARGVVKSLISEQPLLVALGSATVGAAIAALLPLAESERELLEPLKHRAYEAAKSALAEALGEKVKKKAEHAAEKIEEQVHKRETEAHEKGEHVH